MVDLYRQNGGAPAPLPSISHDAAGNAWSDLANSEKAREVTGFTLAPPRPDETASQTVEWDADAEAWVMIARPPPPEPMPPPARSVSAVQAKTALHNAGLYAAAEAAVQNHPYELFRIWWASAQAWREDHPYVAGVAAELGLTDDQVADLFTAAERVAT